LNAATCQKEHGNQCTRTVEAVSAPGNNSELVVEPLDEPVGQPGPYVSDDSLQVLTDSPCGFDKRFQLGARGPTQPVFECLPCTLDVLIVKGLGKRFLEEIGSVETFIVLLDLAQLTPFGRSQIPWVLQQREAATLDSARFVRISRLTNHRPTDFIDGVRGELLDMETIEDDLGLWQSILHSVNVAFGHVDRHVADVETAIGAELVEEALEDVTTATLVSPDDSTAIVVDDCGQVPVTLSVAELVDADRAQSIEPLWVEPTGDDALDDGTNRLPGDAHELRNLCLVCNLSEVGDQFLEVPGEATALRSPGDLLGHDAVAAWATHTARGVRHPQGKAPKGQVSPVAHGALVILRRLTATFSATRFLPRRTNFQNEAALLVHLDRSDEQLADSDELSEYCGDAHGFLPHVICRKTTDKAGASCAFQYFRLSHRAGVGGPAAAERPFFQVQGPTKGLGEPYFLIKS